MCFYNFVPVLSIRSCFSLTQAHDTVSVSISGTRSVSWTTGGSSYEPLRSAMSTKIHVCKTTGWLLPSCTATPPHGCLSHCVSQCVTVPASDRRHPPAEKRSPCSTSRLTARENWRGLGSLRWDTTLEGNYHAVSMCLYLNSKYPFTLPLGASYSQNRPCEDYLCLFASTNALFQLLFPFESALL